MILSDHIGLPFEDFLDWCLGGKIAKRMSVRSSFSLKWPMAEVGSACFMCLEPVWHLALQENAVF